MNVALLLALLTFPFISSVLTLGSTPAVDPSNADWTPPDCPYSCYCSKQFSQRLLSHLKTVDCANQGLNEIPVVFPRDTQALSLAGNSLKSINRYTFDLPQLLTLDLSGNQISYLGRPALFERCSKLRYLNLASNQLGHLKNNVFQGLFNVVELDVSDNRLSTISDEAFAGLLKLESLYLSDNKLTFAHASWWSRVRKLYELKLNGNYLTILQSDTFRHLKNLIFLDVSSNKLFRVNEKAFRGLDQLEYLNLANNHFATIPKSAFQLLHASLKSLNLNQNPVLKISEGDFTSLGALKHLSLSHMIRLRLIDDGAFHNLPSLMILEAHDNPNFAYMSPKSFRAVPALSHLMLHNNNLTVFEGTLAGSLPSLHDVTFYGNPLYCDCSAGWLYAQVASKDHQIQFTEADKLVCDGPENHRFKLLGHLSSSDFPKACPPRLIPILEAHIAQKYGEAVMLECRSVAVPAPSIEWRLPNGDIASAGLTLPNLQVSDSGSTLIVSSMVAAAAGRYTCIAKNSQGRLSVKTVVQAVQLQVQVFPTKVSSKSALVAWKGTDRTRNVFQILYRRDASRSQHNYAGSVTPMMRSYTLRDLLPHTRYEVCIAFEDTKDVVVHISCTKFTTKTSPNNVHVTGIERTSNVAVGVALAVVACMLIIVCLSWVALKRSSRKAKLELFYDDVAGVEFALSSPQRGDPSLSSSVSILNPMSIRGPHTTAMADRSGKYRDSPSLDNIYSPLVTDNKYES